MYPKLPSLNGLRTQRLDLTPLGNLLRRTGGTPVADSLLRKIYIHGPIGVSQLESDYGGRKEIGYYVGHHRDAGGSAIRKAIQQLEAAGLVAKHGRKGRILTGKGVSLLDRQSTEILKELAKTKPELARYL